MDDQHKCFSCRFSFKNEQELLQHVQDGCCGKAQQKKIATGMEHVCEHCGKSFGQKWNLQRHLRSSTCQNTNQHHCPGCTISFERKLELLDHIKNEHQILAELKCPKCEKKFSNKPNLNRHIKSHVCERRGPQQIRHQCLECTASFPQKRILLDHIRKEHQILLELKCPKCEKKFSKKSSLDRHLKSSVCNKDLLKHRCEICHASFSSKRNLEKHILKDHPTDAATLLPNLTCSTCRKTFPQKERLNLHKEKGYCEKREHQHPCPECGKTYKFRKTMLRHMRDFHPQVAPMNKPHRLTDVGGYHCCGETFANGREYRTHKDRVHIRKPEDTITKRITTFICKECQQQFDRKSELIKHKEEHHPPEDASSDDDELPKHFKCPYKGCQECFQSRVELAEHKKVHREKRNENNALCDLCGEWFESTDEVRHHQMDNHDIPGYSGQLAYLHCLHPGCDSRFDKRDDLLNHRKTQHKIQCEQCDEEFESEKEMSIHAMDKHDPNDDPESEEALLEDLELLLDTASAKSLYTKIGIDIVDKAGEKMFKSMRTRQSFKLTPKALRLCEVGLALKVLSKLANQMHCKLSC